MFKKLNRNVAFIVGVICLSLFLALAFEFIINKVFPQPQFHFNRSRLIAVASVTSATILLVKYRAYFVARLHKAFLLIALVFGTAFILVFPKTTYVSPDDQVHFRQAYMFAHQSIDVRPEVLLMESTSFTRSAIGGFSSMAAAYYEMDEMGRNVPSQQYHVDNPPQLYSIVNYLPFHLGFEISNFLHLKFTTGVVIAKLFNLICYVALIYFAIKISGKFNKIFFVVGLLLCNVFLATQFSYDPLITASLLLAISAFLYIRQTKNVPTKYFFLFILAATFGCLAKAVYCPILLLALMIPNTKFDCKRRAVAFKVCAMVVMVLLAATFILPVLSGGMASDLRGGDTSVSGQISFLIQNPLKAGLVAIMYLVSSLPPLLFDAIWMFKFSSGAVPIVSKAAVVLPLVQVLSMIVVFRALYTTSLSDTTITQRSKLALTTIFMMIIGAITAALYLCYTPVGSLTVSGVQSRYFMPIFPILMVLLIPSRQTQDREKPAQDYVTMFAMYACLALVFAVYILQASRF